MNDQPKWWGPGRPYTEGDTARMKDANTQLSDRVKRQSDRIAELTNAIDRAYTLLNRLIKDQDPESIGSEIYESIYTLEGVMVMEGKPNEPPA